jgi:hypothetical protein
MMWFLSTLAKCSPKKNYHKFHRILKPPNPETKLGLPWLIKSIAIRGAKLEYSPLVDRRIAVKEKGPAINAFEIAGPFSEWALSLGY